MGEKESLPTVTRGLLPVVLGERTSGTEMGTKKGYKAWRPLSGEPGAVRTHDPRLKRALLYQLSYGLK